VEHYSERKINRQHAPICQSSLIENDISERPKTIKQNSLFRSIMRLSKMSTFSFIPSRPNNNLEFSFLKSPLTIGARHHHYQRCRVMYFLRDSEHAEEERGEDDDEEEEEGSNEEDDDHDRGRRRRGETPSPCTSCFTDFEQMT
jgi:hypothetical protein